MAGSATGRINIQPTKHQLCNHKKLGHRQAPPMPGLCFLADGSDPTYIRATV